MILPLSLPSLSSDREGFFLSLDFFEKIIMLKFMDKKPFEFHGHPRPFYPYLVLGMSILFIFYKMMILTLPEAMREMVMNDLGLSINEVENLSAVSFYTMILFPIPMGLLIDRFSSTKFVGLSILIASLGAFIFAKSQTFETAIFGRILIGFGISVVLINVAKIISNWFIPSRFAELLSLAIGIGFLGGIVGQHYFAYSAQIIGWRMSLIHLSIAGFTYCLLYFLIVKDQALGAKYNINPKTKKIPLQKGLKICLKNPHTWFLIITTGLLFSSVIMLGGIFEMTLLETTNQLTKQDVPRILLGFFVAFAISAPMINTISTRHKKRKPYVQGGAALLLILSLFLIFVTGGNVAYYQVLYLLLGVSAGAISVVFTMIHETFVPKMTGTTMSFLLVSMGLSYAIEFHLIETIKRFHPLISALTVLPIAIFIALFFSFFLFETKAKQRLSMQAQSSPAKKH
jgi:predicted MFS family arabinose efflux permease